MNQQSRKDPRAKVLSMTVRYRSATLNEFIEHHSYDVSRGGMFIKTPTPFPAGTLLKFEVKIAGDQRVMQGVGRVVWRRDQPGQHADEPTGMGIKFIKIDEASRTIIEKLVESRGQGTMSAFDKSPVEEAPMFPAGATELPSPEDRTVMKPASELLLDALKKTGGEASVDAAPASEPLTVVESSVEVAAAVSLPPESLMARSLASPIIVAPTPVAMPAELAAGAALSPAAAPSPAAALSPGAAPPPAPVAASAQPAEASPRPVTSSGASAAAQDTSTLRAARAAAAPAPDADEDGGGGRAFLLLLVAAGLATGIFFLTKLGHRPDAPREEPAPAASPSVAQAVEAKPVAPAIEPAPVQPGSAPVVPSTDGASAPVPTTPPSETAAPVSVPPAAAPAPPAPAPAPPKPAPRPRPRAPKPEPAAPPTPSAAPAPTVAAAVVPGPGGPAPAPAPAAASAPVPAPAAPAPAPAPAPATSPVVAPAP